MVNNLLVKTMIQMRRLWRAYHQARHLNSSQSLWMSHLKSAHYSSAYNVKKDYEVDPYYSQNGVPQTKPSLKSDSHNTVNTPVGIKKPKRRKINFDSRYEDNGH